MKIPAHWKKFYSLTRFSSLHLRTNVRGGGERFAASRGTSLCCVNGWRAFIWQYLTLGRRCNWMSHNSEQFCLNGASSVVFTAAARGTYVNQGPVIWLHSYALIFTFLQSVPVRIKLEVCYLVCRRSWYGFYSPGQLCSEPAVYLEARAAAAGTLKSFCLPKHLGPTRGWIAAW